MDEDGDNMRSPNPYIRSNDMKPGIRVPSFEYATDTAEHAACWVQG